MSRSPTLPVIKAEVAVWINNRSYPPFDPYLKHGRLIVKAETKAGQKLVHLGPFASLMDAVAFAHLTTREGAALLSPNWKKVAQS